MSAEFVRPAAPFSPKKGHPRYAVVIVDGVRFYGGMYPYTPSSIESVNAAAEKVVRLVNESERFTRDRDYVA